MKTAYAIHELVLDTDRISPNSVIELDDKTFAELDAMGAVREATADEAAIAGLTAKPAASTAAQAPATKKTAAEKKAEKKAEEDAAAAAKKAEEEADPDVTEQTGESDLLGGN